MTDENKPDDDDDDDDSVPHAVERRNVDKMQRPAEYAQPSQDKPPSADKQPFAEGGTLPFTLPLREAATPATGVPKFDSADDPATKPLDMPLRPPGETTPVTVQMVEENTGVLSVTESSVPKRRVSREISAAVDAIMDDRPPEKPVTVELVEEITGQLSASKPSETVLVETADPPAKPLSVAAGKLAAQKATAAPLSTKDAVARDHLADTGTSMAKPGAGNQLADTNPAAAKPGADDTPTDTAASVTTATGPDKPTNPTASPTRPAGSDRPTDTAASVTTATSPDKSTNPTTSPPAGSDRPNDAAASAINAPGSKQPTQDPAPATEAAGSTKPANDTGAPTRPPQAADRAFATKSPEAVDRATRMKAPTVPPEDLEETTTSAADDKSDEDLVPWVAPGEDGFQLADEIGDAPPPLVPNPPVLASPQEAALEAARIVSEMVDIESESGAVIAAAAAAGAAIEAAKAAQKANLDPSRSQPSMRIPAELTGAQSHDPITTVRLSRDRILAALADEDNAVPVPVGRDAPSRHPRARTEPGRGRARTEPGTTEEDAYEDFDPVAIAAAAIGRLRARARTDLAELRVHYHRHDILVLLLALVIIIVAGRVHGNLVTPATQSFPPRGEENVHGLTFEHPSSLLKPEPVPPIAPRLVRDPTGAAAKQSGLYHVELSAVVSPRRSDRNAGPGRAKLEILIDKKPTWSNIVTGLELDRRSRWGELYTLDDSSVHSIAGHDWLRTAYRYAHVADKGDEPRVDHAVELATIDREQIYVLTIYGTLQEIEEIEDVVAPSLRVPTQTGLPLVPQTSRLSQRKYPTPVGRAFDSTVMVVVADLVDGRLKARGGGSGVIVGREGSILTNYHVIHDKDGRLHDVFIIGRFSEPDLAPQLQCAGRPSRSKLQRELDLALIKCDMDLDGRTWSPETSGIWANLPEARAADVKIGQRLWVLGYPDVGGGGLQLGTAEVDGWTGEDGVQGKDFIKTNGSITHGNSGGPVIDDNGKLVGIASAFRTRVTASGGVIETAQVGLVRPLQTASNLLAYAVAGWTPREGYTDVEITPSAVEASAEGIRIFTNVIDGDARQPVRDATVMVLKPGIKTSAIDMNALDDQAIAWGKTNALGEVRLKQLVPVPGTYTVMVIAPGYEPLIGENELHLDANTPASFDPWDKITLRSR